MKGINEPKELNRYISTLTEVFLNEKRINVCKHRIKMARSEIITLPRLISSLTQLLFETVNREATADIKFNLECTICVY